jgi:hypothetical protein
MFEETDEKARLEVPASAFYYKNAAIKTPACLCGQITSSRTPKEKKNVIIFLHNLLNMTGPRHSHLGHKTDERPKRRLTFLLSAHSTNLRSC